MKINKNESIDQLKEIIKARKAPEFNFITTDRIWLWKVQIRGDSDKELTKLMLRKEDQLLPTRKISSYFPEEPFDEHIHIIIKPLTPYMSLDLVYKMGLLNEGDSVEYSERDHNYKATLHGCYLCYKDRKFRTFTEFIRAARKLKLGEQLQPYYFYKLKINGMTYWEVREKIYKMIFCNENEGDLFALILF